jgi:23S rRNA-/tRNA-specific pseudouridylate synthase
VHRIDRPASGDMVFARTSKAASRLAVQFRDRTTEKRYLALVEGAWAGAGTCDDHLVKDHRHVRVVAPERNGAKRARLHYRVVATHGGRSLVVVELETGRPHQIRVQLSHRGHPIIGDFRYKGAQEFDGRNLALHAFRLALDHPTQATRMAWQAAPEGWDPRFEDAVAAVLNAYS